MGKLICRWFGHKWARGMWLRTESMKFRTDICSRCGSQSRWHSLINPMSKD